MGLEFPTPWGDRPPVPLVGQQDLEPGGTRREGAAHAVEVGLDGVFRFAECARSRANRLLSEVLEVKDAALERRFQRVKVEEPSVEDAIKILQGLRHKYELHHKAVYSDDALEAAVKLGNKYWEWNNINTLLALNNLANAYGGQYEEEYLSANTEYFLQIALLGYIIPSVCAFEGGFKDTLFALIEAKANKMNPDKGSQIETPPDGNIIV